jgi:hypothetical protein
MAVPWALATLPVQRRRHVRMLSNVRPEKRRDVSYWPMAVDLPAAAKWAAVRLGSARRRINLPLAGSMTQLRMPCASSRG